MENKITQILRQSYYAYCLSHHIPLHVQRVINQLLKCRTSNMGGHAHVCPNCQHTDVWYNSCKHRFCPQCSNIKNEQWLQIQHKKFLKMDHFHIIFTIPEELNQAFLYNKEIFTNFLFKASNNSLETFLQDIKWLGATTGKIITLQTWASNLTLHPHLHCLVSAGGLKNNKLIIHKRQYLAPAKAMSKVFRGKLLDFIKTAVRADKINFGPDMDKTEFTRILNNLYYMKWNVSIMPKYTYTKGVLKYIANYIKGGPIKQSRIVYFDNSIVKFKYRSAARDNKKSMQKDRIMTLKIPDFIKRFLLHIPYPGQHTTRYYGLYSANNVNNLNIARTALYQEPLEKGSTLQTTDAEINQTNEKKVICPICKCVKISYMNLKPIQLKKYIRMVGENKLPISASCCQNSIEYTKILKYGVHGATFNKELMLRPSGLAFGTRLLVRFPQSRGLFATDK